MASLTYRSKIESEDTDSLFEAVLTLENIDDCYKFFGDICTIKEIESISQRLEVAKLLTQKNTYNEIEKKTSASTATISRVNRSIKYGLGGYDLVLDKLNKID